MTVDTSALTRFASRAGVQAKAAKKEWAPPTLERFHHGNVLAFDQSLSATGAVALSCRPDGLHVVESTTLRTKRPGAEAGKEGPQEAVQRAYALRWLVRGFLERYAYGWVVVNEAPPTGGNKLERPESSLMAAQVIHFEALDFTYQLAPMIAIGHHKQVTGGDAKAKKPAHHAVLKAWAPSVVRGFEKVTNSDERDALSVGLTYLLENERKEQ